MITVKDVMAYYHISRTTVQHWMKQGMPFYKTGGLVRFVSSEVYEWVRRDKK